MNRVFYHRMDLDGHAAGAIARRGLEAAGEGWKLYPYDYGDPFPEAEIETADTVWFLDVVWQPLENVARLARERRCRVVVIDHHRSVAESGALDGLEVSLSANSSRAACLLAWERFAPGKRAPEWLDLLNRYDIWDDGDREAWQGRVLPFQMGMQAQRTDPAENWPFWRRLFACDAAAAERFVRRTMRVGRWVLAWTEARNSRDARDHSFEARFQGMRAICINSTVFGSAALDAVWDPARHDLMLVYARRGDGNWRVALFAESPDVDVSRIAAGLGGGGHRGAAGLTARSVSVSAGEVRIVPLHRPGTRLPPGPSRPHGRG